MAMRTCRVKTVIIIVPLIILLILPCLLLIFNPTAILVQNAPANLLKYLMGTNIDGEGRDYTSPHLTGVNHTAIREEFPGLNEVLHKAALPNKTIVITTLNAAWAAEDTMIDLFLGSFHFGEGISHYLNHLLIIALDEPSYNRCRKIHQHCFRLETAGVDFAGEKFFMSEDYLKMLWRRVEFLRIVLELGYDLLFTDADILWFRDPFTHLSPDADFQIACDVFNGNPTDLNNYINGGFLFVRSNRRTVDFYKFWYDSRLTHPSQHDQDVFNAIKQSEEVKVFKMKMEFLDTTYFGGFCQPSRDLSKVCTMHANCCTSLERKLFDLRLTIWDWARYKAMTSDQRNEQRVDFQAPKECLKSWGG